MILAVRDLVQPVAVPVAQILLVDELGEGERATLGINHDLTPPTTVQLPPIHTSSPIVTGSDTVRRSRRPEAVPYGVNVAL